MKVATGYDGSFSFPKEGSLESPTCLAFVRRLACYFCQEQIGRAHV